MKASEIFDLKGRVAMVTGASSGLGTRFAQVLAANGAAVALVARRADRLKDLQQKIEKAGGKAIAVEADVLDRASMTRAFDQVEKALGTVTILVNNAGVAHSTRATDVTEEEWRRVVGTNLDAVFFCAQEAREADARRRQEGRDRQHRLGARLRRVEGHHRLFDRQGRRDPDDQGARASSSPSRACASTPSRRAGSSPRSTAII